MVVNRRLRYRDFVERGIFRNRVTLRNRILYDNFPKGELTGPNERTWDESEVEQYLATRSSAPAAPRGIAKAKAAARKAIEKT